ncbi:tripartite tricarboxylate transporter TctB family protein [Aquicoccus porphyridii]|uniref:Tripartite tricarboxylate transporter TctB family protein n=1 Tax=Aquicoccus porphyridii TaxID=1852029 RepID=A0A5A9Z641_9RHOB|nr:tripartite tricarboxylate transporter TctB family protein [Aquicoccus porphyridii]KAA0912614.1 tripartite tricarboxylate transporter TctB family protein [Aquicoccus porphyridii]RAI55425.1 tripartite tricarboxylate transporter TctB family protein [Rhodobacteraceae bacterium AsT-22]
MTEEERRFKGPVRGQSLFAIIFVVASLLLLSQLGNETRWAKGTQLFAQPRFWPAVAVGGMVLFGLLHLWALPRKRLRHADLVEWRIWFFALEWVLWFLAYVMVVPVLGYLPSTLIFVPLLAWRVGYRGPRMLWISAGFAVAVVIVFKTFLQVRIPGGAVYEYLPGALRSFLILNF